MSRFLVIISTLAIVAGCTVPKDKTPDPNPEPDPDALVVVDVDGAPIAGASVVVADWTGFAVSLVSSDDGTVQLPVGERLVMMTVDAPDMLAVTRQPLKGPVTLLDDSDRDDSDGDGVSNGEEAELGTDPEVADTDSDGINDGDEAKVIEGFAPVALGANPLRRDMFVELDWWSEFGDSGRFGSGAQDLLNATFRDSSLKNPDGTFGIEVHVDAGEFGGGTAVEVDEWCDYSEPNPLRFDVAPERRSLFFHVTMVPLREQCGHRGIAYATRSVMVDPIVQQDAGVRDLFWAGVVAHELGHTLGLSHGGDEEVNCKPNYPSLMNYDYLPMILMGSVSFSRGTQPPIDENAIVESQPFLVYPGYDFNKDGKISSTPYAMDLNDGTWMDPALAEMLYSVAGRDVEEACSSSGDLTVLTDHDDWPRIDRGLPAAVGLPLGEGNWSPWIGPLDEPVRE
ncbi:MAG: hypothetical protein KDB26_05130 [Microthrixaceae bacterium]|nr:hypothetical protein [Microthrixaceae bacterium]